MSPRNTLVLTLFMVAAPTARAQVADSGRTQNQLEDVLRDAQPARDDFLTIYQLDVFSYFSLDQYDTDLKKAVFKKSSEYQLLLDSLKTLKKQIAGGRWYVTPGWELTDYDVDAHGFHLILGLNTFSCPAEAQPPKSHGDFLFPSLPTKRVSYLPEYYPSQKQERLFLPMSEENGLAIETEGNARIYLLFAVAGVREVSYDYYLYGGDEYTNTGTYLTTDSIRVVVGNASTGKVYFNKEY